MRRYLRGFFIITSDSKNMYTYFEFWLQRVYDDWTYRRNWGGKNKRYLLYFCCSSGRFAGDSSVARSFDRTNGTHDGLNGSQSPNDRKIIDNISNTLITKKCVFTEKREGDSRSMCPPSIYWVCLLHFKIISYNQPQ